jgi:hypothetical protein
VDAQQVQGQQQPQQQEQQQQQQQQQVDRHPWSGCAALLSLSQEAAACCSMFVYIGFHAATARISFSCWHVHTRCVTASHPAL